MDSYGIYAILLLVVGLAILAAEVFIPSGGLLFATTVIILLGSIWCAYAAWWQSDPQLFWTFCVVELLMVPLALVGAFTLLPRTKFGKRILLDAPDLDHVTPFAKETARLSQLIGQHGAAKTLLNPGGIVEIQGGKYHAFTEGLMLNPGEPVEIAEVRGTRLLVRPMHPASGTDARTAAEEPSPLDFEIPGS